MMISKKLFIAGAVLFCFPAIAEDGPNFDGLFSDSLAGCDALETDNKVVDPEFVAFNPYEGLWTLEFHCDFLDVQSQPDGWNVATAFCEYPGEQYADLITFSSINSDGSVQLVSTVGYLSASDDDGEPHFPSGTYLLCENLNE